MYVIAEVGQAHEGSLGLAISYIQAAAESGANAIKFQMHIAHAESSILEEWRIPFSYEDSSRYDYWKRMEFTKDQWIKLKTESEKYQLDFIVSPFSVEALELCRDIGISIIKIGSGEVNNRLLFDSLYPEINQLIISSGLSELDEIENTLNNLSIETKITILNCTSEYPCPPEKWALSRIKELQDRFKNLTIGHSDHSGTPISAYAALIYGAKVLEVHIVFDKRSFGPDSKASLTINELKEMTQNIEILEKAIESEHSIDPRTKNIFTKSLTLRKPVKKGERIQKSHLESTKPANAGIPAANYLDILERKVNRDMYERDFINYTDLI